jgi:hypothetical protein
MQVPPQQPRHLAAAARQWSAHLRLMASARSAPVG